MNTSQHHYIECHVFKICKHYLGCVAQVYVKYHCHSSQWLNSTSFVNFDCCYASLANTQNTYHFLGKNNLFLYKEKQILHCLLYKNVYLNSKTI